MVTATFDGKVADTQEGDAGYKDFLYRQLLRVSHLFVRCGTQIELRSD